MRKNKQWKKKTTTKNLYQHWYKHFLIFRNKKFLKALKIQENKNLKFVYLYGMFNIQTEYGGISKLNRSKFLLVNGLH